MQPSWVPCSLVPMSPCSPEAGSPDRSKSCLFGFPRPHASTPGSPIPRAPRTINRLKAICRACCPGDLRSAPGHTEMATLLLLLMNQGGFVRTEQCSVGSSIHKCPSSDPRGTLGPSRSSHYPEEGCMSTANALRTLDACSQHRQ